MAKRSGDENIRKLVRVGGDHTYSVTLPIEAIREFGWQEGQQVTVEVDRSNKQFIIKDWNG